MSRSFERRHVARCVLLDPFRLDSRLRGLRPCAFAICPGSNATPRVSSAHRLASATWCRPIRLELVIMPCDPSIPMTSVPMRPLARCAATRFAPISIRPVSPRVRSCVRQPCTQVLRRAARAASRPPILALRARTTSARPNLAWRCTPLSDDAELHGPRRAQFERFRRMSVPSRHLWSDVHVSARPERSMVSDVHDGGHEPRES